MISSLPKTSTPVDAAAAAPTLPESAAASPAPFDFILALETLAAQSADRQALAADAALVECGELLGEEEGFDEIEDEADEDSLEFLAGLITLTAARQDAHHARSANLVSAAAGSASPHEGAAGAAAVLAGLTEQEGAAAEFESAPESGTTFAARAGELTGPAPRAAAAEHSVAVHVRDPRWAEDFGTRVSLLVRARESQAAIQLTPVDLGPVDVNVTVRDSQATIHFGAANADTRALIEASLPKLREMLAAQGFNLLDASVSQGFTQNDQPQATGVPRPGTDAMADTEPVTVRHLNGLLDLYA
jgi:flagellar hook-length control protein FliK